MTENKMTLSKDMLYKKLCVMKDMEVRFGDKIQTYMTSYYILKTKS